MCIHMNGRAYDYNLGRFLSVDPFVQAPGNSQSMNPYSYIMNNPLAGTDPTGYEGVGIRQEQMMMYENPEFGSKLKEIRLEGAEKTLEAIIVVDTISDFVAPVKGVVKKGIKETIKATWKKAKELFKNKPKVDNGKNTSQDVRVNNDASKPETIGDQSKNRTTQNNHKQSNSENAEARTYHRLGDKPENVQSIKDSGELKGNPPTNTYASDIPKVKAYDGPLPEGKKGFEFKTSAKPDTGGKPGQLTWSGNGHNPDVKTVNGQAVIKCTVTKDNSC